MSPIKKKFDTNLTDAAFKGKIISALRMLSRWWTPKQEAIGRARIKRGVYKCELCWTEWPWTLPPLKGKKRKRKNINADHIREVVPVTGFTTYDDFIKRLFVSAEQFQSLCWECHSWPNWKTQFENKERRTIKNWWEVWRKVDEFPEFDYYISNLWRVKNINSWRRKTKWEKILSIQDNWKWYSIVAIWHSIKRKVHRLVAQAFIWEVEWLLVCHKDDNPKNNNANNLFIWTHQDNMDDKMKKWRHILWWKSITQYSLKWELLKEWKWGGWEITRELWFWSSWIYSCCNWKYKQSMWFIWKRSE